jgi:uncharacterized protein
VLSALLIAVLVKLVMMVWTVLVVGAVGGTGTLPRAVAVMLLLGLIPLALYLLTRRQGWAATVGFNGPGRWREPWLIWLPALYAFINLTNLIGKPVSMPEDWRAFLNPAVQAISVPLIEEFAFRGLILAVLLARWHAAPGEVRRAVFISSGLFGLWHLPVMVHDPIIGLGNVLYATMAGVGFAAVVLRTRSIWPILLVHVLIVFTSVLSGLLLSGQSVASGMLVPHEAALRSAVVTNLALVPLFLYGLWLLRKPIQLEPRAN